MAMERCPYCGNTVFLETGAGAGAGRVCAGPLGCHAPVGAAAGAEPGAEPRARAA
jgi:hypothetical protein